MKATICPFEPVSFARITQLVNKTNQFNLTTRRLTGAEVQAMATGAMHFTRTVRLGDRFGDHGLVSVLFGRIEGKTITLDGWLMSCRVLGRSVEQMVLRELILRARERGIKQLVGRYIPSGRNDMVKDHYAKLGFTAGPEDGIWLLDVAAPEPAATMRIHRSQEKAVVLA